MKDTKRYTHTYKTNNSVYKKAMARAKKVDKVPLAKQIEQWVTSYGESVGISSKSIK